MAEDLLNKEEEQSQQQEEQAAVNEQEEIKESQEEAQKPAKDEKKKSKKSKKTKDEKEALEEEIEKLNAEKAELNDRFLRLNAEYDNYRKRTLKEKMELTKSAGESLLINLLPVMDDFERGLQHMEEADEQSSFKEGIDIIHSKLKDFMKQNGLKEIESKEKDFDTDLHEAIAKIPAPTEELKGKVVDVIQKGYYLNDKVIRHAKVVVGE